MTGNYDSDTFEIRFEDATNAMHRRTHRGNEPSGHVWETVRAQAGTVSRAETADPRAFGPGLAVDTSTSERKREMDAALQPLPRASFGDTPQRGRWMAVLAAGLAGIMLVTSIWLYGGGVPPNSRTDLAWAPGIGTAESLGLASPAATPLPITYGPQYACTVEPLTIDDVFDTVLNPTNGYVRRGYPVDPTARKYEESRGAWPQPVDTSRLFAPQEDEIEVAQDAIDTANMFWNCLMTGNAYQVWALTSPELVQAEVLLNLPVVRSEEDIRSYIEEWGPRRYSAGLGLIWPDLGGHDPAEVGAAFNGSPIPEEGYGGILVGGQQGTREIALAMVPLSGEPTELREGGFYIEISLRLHPDGSWSVSGYNYPNALG